MTATPTGSAKGDCQQQMPYCDLPRARVFRDGVMVVHPQYWLQQNDFGQSPCSDSEDFESKGDFSLVVREPSIPVLESARRMLRKSTLACEGAAMGHDEAVRTLATEKYLLGEMRPELREQLNCISLVASNARLTFGLL